MALVVASAFVCSAAHAEPSPVDVARARDEFVAGAAAIRELQYADALAAFERSVALRPHPVTTYNIGACLRAMGRYTRARKAFRAALAEDDRAGKTAMSSSLRAEAAGFLEQIEKLLARVDVVLEPSDAAISVDGHPLEATEASPQSGLRPVLLAGTRPPGPGEAPPAARFSIIIDPGAHVFTLTRKGFADAVVNRSFAPGSSAELILQLDRLPATLAFSSNVQGAVVTVDGMDVGVAPIDIQRPPGRYHVVVKKPGFVAYESDFTARPGERVDLQVSLKEERPALTQRWWFWTAAGVVVAGAVAGTYFATRPEPERPPLNGGGLGWTLEAR